MSAIEDLKALVWQLDNEAYEAGAERGDVDKIERIRVDIFNRFDSLVAFEVALRGIVAMWEYNAPYWRDEVCDDMAALARDALASEKAQ